MTDEYEHNGLTITIDQDECAWSPREWDNLGTMVCWHPDYALGDKQFTNPDGRGAVENRVDNDNYRSLEHLSRCLTLLDGAVCVLPLSIYEHSGLTMYVGNRGGYPFDSAGWDTTTVGFVYTTRERIIELCGEDAQYQDPEWIEAQLRGEVKEYAQYLEGDVYVYAVSLEGETIESCGGFFGYDDVKAEAESAADAFTAQEKATILLRRAASIEESAATRAASLREKAQVLA